MTDKQGQVLLLLRARDPGKGKFGIPGGFVDAGETPEDALKREIMEEVGLKVTRFSYLCSFPNQYAYKGVVLPVADLFYQVSVRSFSGMKPQEGEIDGWVFCHPGRKELNNLAFESNRKALQFYLRQQKKKGTGQ
ncbi:MAG: NUDIX domain-containing protein [Planctomycetaceae bacterium]|nr:NUDIX domain-containing protein [Planctomycetaceae bacterium]